MLPGYTHNIINLSEKENLVTLMWANEIFVQIPVEWSARSGGTARPFQNERRGAPLIRVSAISQTPAC